MLIFEALRAAHGDALILHFGTKTKPRIAVIDGGPAGVHNDALRPRLDEIRKERKLAATAPLDIDLMMVSHIDDDHLVGILDLVGDMKDRRDNRKPVPCRIRRFWHNSFDDIIGDTAGTGGAGGSASLASTAELASLSQLAGGDGSAIIASVPKGRDLRKLVDAFGLGGNPPFNGLVMNGHATVPIGNLSVTVIAPDKPRLDKLQKKWDREIKPILKKERTSPAEAAALADYTDNSVHNLSSIVMLVEAGGKRLLLTGDGRGDHTLNGLKAAGLLDTKGKLKVDLLKLPHHGSVRNVKKTYFDTIIAKHYVISANGRDDNPDIATLKMISKARLDDKFTIYLTYPADEYKVPKIGKAVDAFFAREKAAGRRYKVVVRKSGEVSLRIRLAP